MHVRTAAPEARARNILLTYDLPSDYQQAHKYEKGINRVASWRLYQIARALGVEVGYFFEGLDRDNVVKAAPQQRLLELGRASSPSRFAGTKMPSAHWCASLAEPAAGH